MTLNDALLTNPAGLALSSEHGMNYENATFNSGDDKQLKGWLCTPAHPKGIIILCHGVDGNRMG